MAQHAPCPKCAAQQSKEVGFTWWGGVLGPKIFHHVKCLGCGTAYNGKTGKSNQQAIAIYTAVSMAIATFLVVVILKR
jgi:hypothetical protein